MTRIRTSANVAGLQIRLSDYILASRRAHAIVGSIGLPGISSQRAASKSVQYVTYTVTTVKPERDYVGLETTDQWVLEDGSWHVNECSLMPGLKPRSQP